MKSKKSQETNFDIKKWAFFIVFLVVLVLGLYFVLKPQGEKEASQAIAQVERLIRQAREITQRTNQAQDLANYDLARDSLERANKYNIESEFTLAIEEAGGYALKVIQSNTGGTLRSGNRFEEIHGQILVRPKGSGTFKSGDKDTVLGVGDLIKVAPGSGCKVAFDNGLEVVVREDTSVTLQENLGGEENVYRLQLNLESGRLEVKTPEAGRARLIISTSPARVVFFRNSSGAVSLTGSRNPTLEARVRRGRADVRSGPQTLNLNAGEMETFTVDLFKNAALQLPEVPNLINPKPFSKFQVNQNGFASVELSWERVLGATAYHLQVSNDPLFIKLFEERSNVSGFSRELPSLTSGTYFWRVAAIGNNLTGFFSESRQFEILSKSGAGAGPSDSNPPVLIIDDIPVQGTVAIVKGRTDRDATVKVNDELAVVDKEDGTFNHVLNLPGQGVHKVMVVAKSSAGSLAFKEFSISIKD